MNPSSAPLEAIPSDILQELTWMAGQYWFCAKDGGHGTKSSGQTWRCLISQGKLEMKYSDMVKLHSGSSQDDEFNWLENTPAGSGSGKSAAELFTYQEQANYEAYFIELDSVDRPDEIGAMVNDTCIGATKVEPEDTAILICAYTDGFEGDSVTFQLAYNTKKSRPRIGYYYVLNTQTGIKENRKIKIGEKQPYYLVSLTNNHNSLLNQGDSWLQLYPNLSGTDVNISYFVPVENQVDIQLVNLMGQVMACWQAKC